MALNLILSDDSVGDAVADVLDRSDHSEQFSKRGAHRWSEGLYFCQLLHAPQPLLKAQRKHDNDGFIIIQAKHHLETISDDVFDVGPSQRELSEFLKFLVR